MPMMAAVIAWKHSFYERIPLTKFPHLFRGEESFAR